MLHTKFNMLQSTDCYIKLHVYIILKFVLMKYIATVYLFFVVHVGQVFDKIARLRSFAMVAGIGFFPMNRTSQAKLKHHYTEYDF